MAILKSLRKSIGKLVLATVALGGGLAFFGTPSASAEPVSFVRPHVVVRGYFGPRVVYWGPRYYVRGERIVIVRHRYWDPRFHCWHYYR
jgi:hypothetical protein